MLCAFVPWPVASQNVHKAEAVKAFFVCQFAGFLDWEHLEKPEGNQPILVGILGEDIFKGEFEAAAEAQRAKGRHFEIRQSSDPASLTECHLVCVGLTLGEEFDAALDTLHAAGVATICDARGAAERGGMINFTVQEQKVRFEVNLRSSRAAGVRISAQLLKLATAVINGTGGSEEAAR